METKEQTYWRLSYCEPHPGTLQEKLNEDLTMVKEYEAQNKERFWGCSVTKARLKMYRERSAAYAVALAVANAASAAAGSVMSIEGGE